MSGKGSAARNCFSRKFKDNFEKINWRSKSETVLATPILFYFTTRDPKLQGDFLEVSSLIGLREVYGDNVVDVPRKNVLYNDFSETPRESLHGNGFIFYDGIQDLKDPSLRNLRPRAQDIIVYGTVEYGILNEGRDHGDCKNVFYLDGGDVPDIRIKPCFKRELFREDSDVYPFGFGIPSKRIREWDFLKKTKLIPKTCPDTELMEEFSTSPKVHFHKTLGKYLFDSEQDYIDDIANSWFFPVTKRGGWDSLRHYEGAAYGTLVLFKNYDTKPKECSPADFPTISYKNKEELKAIMDRLVINNEPTDGYFSLLRAQREWLERNGTCEARAKHLVQKIKQIKQ